ncbi:helix-turn-helix domain-containing protein [Streptomyces roseoverticillatus]|uniref:helix-turn-helix domain-containing protein n=1 Tax=Streptomyces roseoverticillatus TaxID=66429 RepID=UPI001FDF052E|nr:helix-turn-helix transcriptional regulator [Streptomyces roseoverticillatus]
MGTQTPNPQEIVAGLLDDERFRSACGRRDMGTVFRLLNHRGVSTRRLASLVEITQGRLYDYMSGKSRVEKLALFEQIADALHIPGDLLGLARRSWEPQVPASADETPLPPDADDLDAVSAFRDADRQAGGGRLYQAVVRHLSENVARRLVDSANGPKAFAAAAAFTEMAGWMAHDSGLDDLAERHFVRALPLARMSGDVPLAAGVAASRSHLALQSGGAAQARHWARAGLGMVSRGPRIPSLVARLYAMEARALAAAGEASEAERSLARAQAALHSPREAGSGHSWTSPFDAASLASESALVLRDLGKHEDALNAARQAIDLRLDGRARSLGFSRVTLVDVHLHRTDLDAAVHAGVELLTTTSALGSVRFVGQLADLRRAFGLHCAYAPAREFLRLLDDDMRKRSVLLADIMRSPGTGGTA